MTLDELALEVVSAGPGRQYNRLKSIWHEFTGQGRKGEGAACDFKRDFDPGSPRAWPSLAKDIVAFANSGGGLLIFGVDDDGSRLGVEQSLSNEFDAATINAQIESKAPGARIQTTYFELGMYRKTYGYLAIQPHDQIVVFEREWGYNDESGKQRTVVRPGVLYTRGIAETRPAKQEDLRLIVQRLAEVGAQRLLARVERVAALPASAELIAFNPDQSSTGVHLVSSKEGHPVRIVDESDESAIPIAEVLTGDIPYGSAQAEFLSQVRAWRGHPEHRAHRLTLVSWYLAREDLDITDDMAEFAFRSAGEGHGYPMFWAATMSENRLDKILAEELDALRHPMRQVLPFVVGAFRWSDRKRLLADPRRFQGAGGSAERVAGARSYERFRRRGRFQANAFSFENETYYIDKLAGDKEAAVQVFESMLRAETTGVGGLRGPAFQLDVIANTEPTDF